LSKSSRLLFLILGALALILVLISALPGLALQPGRSLPTNVLVPNPRLIDYLYPWIIFSLIVYTLGLLYFLRRRLTVVLVGLALPASVLLCVMWLAAGPPSPPSEPVTATPAPTAIMEVEAVEELPPEEIVWEEVEPFTPPSGWVVLAASFGVALLLVTAVAGLGYYLWLNFRPLDPPLVELAREAQSAVDSLRSGGRLYDIVIRCYHEMSRTLSESRGIKRQDAMTPREFESYLAAMGLPQEPIRGLTRLFEEARYGAKEPGPEEEEQAIASLTAIVEACEGVS
jgi:hypothetical protein